MLQSLIPLEHSPTNQVARTKRGDHAAARGAGNNSEGGRRRTEHSGVWSGLLCKGKVRANNQASSWTTTGTVA